VYVCACVRGYWIGEWLYMNGCAYLFACVSFSACLLFACVSFSASLSQLGETRRESEIYTKQIRNLHELFACVSFSASLLFACVSFSASLSQKFTRNKASFWISQDPLFHLSGCFVSCKSFWISHEIYTKQIRNLHETNQKFTRNKASWSILLNQSCRKGDLFVS